MIIDWNSTVLAGIIVFHHLMPVEKQVLGSTGKNHCSQIQYAHI